jgi:outer membrane protein OmpA-like peptidoglycan-associated protein
MHDGIATPLAQGTSTVADTLYFTRDRYTLTTAQESTLQSRVATWTHAAKPLLIIAAASRNLPPDYARVLSERRAKSVRQALIEAGMDPTLLHTTGYGNDAPLVVDGDLVTIYQREPQP